MRYIAPGSTRLGRALGPVPADIAHQIAPMPPDFGIPYTSRPNVLAWRGNVIVDTPGSRETAACEVAVRAPAGLDDLRALVWHIKELGRLGYAEGLRAARVDRHRRPADLVSAPQDPAPDTPGAP